MNTVNPSATFILSVLFGLAIGAIAGGCLLLLGYALRDAWCRWWRPAWWRIPVGTRSILVGAHAFWLHPWIVAMAWWRLYGWATVRCPSSGVVASIFSPRLWLCFFVHDLGYWGKPNMDGPEGEEHPILGAGIMHAVDDVCDRWSSFALFHSRFYARRHNHEPSLFCWADKMAIAITPSWLYIPMTTITGELSEYMHVNPREIKGAGRSAWEWHRDCREYCRKLAIEHKDGRPDKWTPR